MNEYCTWQIPTPASLHSVTEHVEAVRAIHYFLDGGADDPRASLTVHPRNLRTFATLPLESDRYSTDYEQARDLMDAMFTARIFEGWDEDAQRVYVETAFALGLRSDFLDSLAELDPRWADDCRAGEYLFASMCEVA